jgi:hypothetical protein
MKLRWFIGAVVVSFAAGSASQALDSVKTMKGPPVSGRVVGMTPVKVELEQGANGGIAKEIPVNQIQTIYYEDEPTELKIAKGHVLGGRYAEALASLQRIK